MIGRMKIVRKKVDSEEKRRGKAEKKRLTILTVRAWHAMQCVEM